MRVKVLVQLVDMSGQSNGQFRSNKQHHHTGGSGLGNQGDRVDDPDSVILVGLVANRNIIAGLEIFR